VYQEAGVIPLPSQFNTLVQGLSIEAITPQQILAAGEPIFLDVRTTSDISSINTLIQSWSRIHVPTFGQPIPGSSARNTRVNAGDVVVATGNEVRMIVAVTYTNAGGAPIVVDLTLGATELQAGIPVDPASTLVATIPSNVYVDSDIDLSVAIVSGDGADLTTAAVSFLVVQ